MPWCHASYTEQNALDWFATCNEALSNETAFEFGVFSESDGELLGGAGLNQINARHRYCNLGYWVRQSKQQQGFASKSVLMLAHFGFETLALNRIEMVVAVGNLASERVAQRSGALLECVARNRLLIHGVPVPASVFSLVPQQMATDSSVDRNGELAIRLA